jgi:hypothetical protein
VAEQIDFSWLEETRGLVRYTGPKATFDELNLLSGMSQSGTLSVSASDRKDFMTEMVVITSAENNYERTKIVETGVGLTTAFEGEFAASAKLGSGFFDRLQNRMNRLNSVRYR